MNLETGIQTRPTSEVEREFGNEPGRARLSHALLVPGRNCWRIERAERIAWLIDGDEYFSAVRAALVQAQQSIFIVGWDIDSRMYLVPGDTDDGFPRQLGDLLAALVAARADLNVHILSWDYAFLFALEREWLTEHRLGAGNQGRLKFQLDDRHPAGASHHQKLIVVDDAVAFVSGLDLTRNRWDTSAHAARDDRRRNADGVAYAPFHDVGIVADGAVARAVGELARTRWHGATGRRLRPVTVPVASDCWPQHISADLRNLDVGIARTEPRFEGDAGVYEIRTLLLDAIEAAKVALFAENQYFTSRTIADAIELRLRQGNAPDVVVVAPSAQSGWLESSTMGVLRARIHNNLTRADAQNHYRLYCPWIVGAEDRATCLNVHSKILIADDEFVTIGSANLSGRSMGLDTECNLAIEANGDPVIARAIARLRTRLLCEHLDRNEADVETSLRSHQGRLIPAIESLRHEGRSLVPLVSSSTEDWTALVPGHSVLDPEEPIDPEALMEDVVARREKRPVGVRTVGIALVLAALAALALIWHYTPLRGLVSAEKLADFAERFSGNPWSPLMVIAAYLVGGLVVVPITAMIAATGIVFGPALGFAYALVGETLSAVFIYYIGRRLGRETVRRLAGRRINAFSRRIEKRGLLAVVVVRVLPIAPFSVVNLIAGALHVRLRDFILGTVLGMAPGTLMLVVFVDRIVAAVRSPSILSFVLVVLLAAALVGIAFAVRKRLDPRVATARPGPRAPGPHDG